MIPDLITLNQSKENRRREIGERDSCARETFNRARVLSENNAFLRLTKLGDSWVYDMHNADPDNILSSAK